MQSKFRNDSIDDFFCLFLFVSSDKSTVLRKCFHFNPAPFVYMHVLRPSIDLRRLLGGWEFDSPILWRCGGRSPDVPVAGDPLPVGVC